MARPVGRSVGDRTIMTVQNCEGVVSEQRHDLGCRLRRVKTSGSGARAAEPGSTDPDSVDGSGERQGYRSWLRQTSQGSATGNVLG